MNDSHQKPVLAVHPTSSGFGWALFDGPDMPVEWGIASAKQGRKFRIIDRFKRLLARHMPAVLVMEMFEGEGTKRAERIQTLCRDFLNIAGAQDMETALYHRKAISALFGLSAQASRYHVAQAIAAQVGDLSHRLPRKRGLLASEDPRQSLFDAAALAIVYFAKHTPPPRAHSGAPE